MSVRDPRGWATCWCGRAVIALVASCVAAPLSALDREQGMPLISTQLPSRFNTPATPVGPQVFALAALPDGAIIAANNAGLLRLSGTHASAWNPTHGNVLSLATTDTGRVYVGGIGQIGYFDAFGKQFETFATWAPRLGVVFGDFWITLAARDGSAYFADSTHVFRWDGHALTLVYAGQPEMLAGALFGEGVVVLDPGAGLVAIVHGQAQLVRGGERLRNAGGCALASAPPDVISVCGDAGVLRWSADGTATAWPIDAVLRAQLHDAGITSAHMSDSGSVLIGTRRAGVFWLDPDAALGGHLAAPEWGDSRVFSLLPRHEDGFWVGLDYGVAHVEWPGQLTRFNALLGLPRAVLATIRIDDQLLAVTTRGVYRLVPATRERAVARFEPYAPTTTTLFGIAQAGTTLFIASGEGVYAVRDGASTLIDTALAYAVFPLDADGTRLLVGGLTGVRLLQRGTAQWQAHAIVGISTEIRRFQPDADGALWLTGNYSGVVRLRPAAAVDAAPTVEVFDATAGLPAGRVFALPLPDGIAFDSEEGLLRFDAQTRRFVADAKLRELLPRAQGETRFAETIDATHAFVVQHDRVRLIERSAAGWRELFTPLARLPRGVDFRDVRSDADGSVWIAGNEALFRHRPDLQSTLPLLPAPQILIDRDEMQQRLDPVAALALGTAPRNVHARFEEAFFVGTEQLRFRTRLSPLESGWSEWQAATERELTHLPGGRYELALQARDTFGRVSAVARATFVLAPPWYLRWWAFAVYALALLVLLAWMIRRRERRLRRRADELAVLVRERTQELEHASITDALTGLRNRHYVEIAGTPWREHERGCWLVALVDIDHFKRINDERGHAAGDDVLRAIARELAQTLPRDAVAVRWGGEEFLVLVTLAHASAANDVVRQMLRAVSHCVVATTTAALAVTCSIGWELVHAGAQATLDDVLGHADRRLYAAKRGGRDRACGPGDAIELGHRAAPALA